VFVNEHLHHEQTERVPITLLGTQALGDHPLERDVRSAFGRSLSCEHANGQWERNGAADDALILSCSACGRYRIACVPLHQRPDPTRPSRSYISRERGYRLLGGDRRTLSAELLLRESRRSLHPGAYRDHGAASVPIDPRRVLRSRRR
jgi:hypothetical protein